MIRLIPGYRKVLIGIRYSIYMRITLTKDQRDLLLLTLIDAHTRNIEDDYQDTHTKRDWVVFKQLLKKL